MQPKVAPSAVDLIHNSPCVELSRLIANTPGVSGRIVAKAEFLSPGLSKKDRIARQMMEDAKEEGRLKPGQTVLELTSGNTGTGLAIVCAVMGHPFIAVMSKGNSIERAKMMQALGAEVILVDQTPNSVPGQVSGADLQLVIEAAERICAERGAFRADQFRLPGNFRAHFLHTGPELVSQTNGAIDAFCDFVGSGGTFRGVAAYLKQHTAAKCYIVEPAGAALLREGATGQKFTSGPHRIQGGGYNMSAEELHISDAHVDGYITVTDEEAIQTARRLAREEGLLVGFSAGANVAAALQLLRGPLKGRTVACLLCDSGMKYLSTDLYHVSSL
eukprot:TRINITY_DN1010_c0_g1_i2.p2 TRINITY_DN1010_c0_g1~~TRINITY_DN1010_c0_g1_i2.p2  ORF type:complete len:331 (-),score=55.41 TRINITY_DN1010_c0_g1_i2:282-1274(-)